MFWKLTKEQEKRYEKNMQEWLNNGELTLNDLITFEKDYTEIKEIVENLISKANEKKLDFKDKIDYVYRELEHINNVKIVQTLEEVNIFQFWDIEYGSITISLVLDSEILVSEFFDGFLDDDLYSFEDIHINVLQKFLKKYLT